MANVLFLVHRLPYPPNKGDKVRSCHLLKHLAARHRVFLGTFVDDPEDEAYVDTVRSLCAGLHVSRLHPRRARLYSLGGLASGKPLTLQYYRDSALTAWVQQTCRTQAIDAVIAFSSSMAQYAAGVQAPLLMDLVDIDSAKWTDYAEAHRWPLSWLYRREGAELLRYERQVAARSQRVFLCTEKEADLFRVLAPESASRVVAMGNGVDCDYFAPDPTRASPFQPAETPLVFTGAMDYWPNIDAVQWFVQDMLPALRQRWPSLRFHIVGRSPAAAVRALASEHVLVTGTVPDVRPYLQHAAAVVAPLRLARGIQNKILEAMAMQQAVVAAQVCAEAIDAVPGEHLLCATDGPDYLQALHTVLADAGRARCLGEHARSRVLQAYAWGARLAILDDALGLALAAREPLQEAA